VRLLIHICLTPVEHCTACASANLAGHFVMGVAQFISGQEPQPTPGRLHLRAEEAHSSCFGEMPAAAEAADALPLRRKNRTQLSELMMLPVVFMRRSVPSD
jgi:hypothetical protein